jgi:cytoskeleton protein RodZ
MESRVGDDATAPGAILATARESLEVTVREVADALNLPNKVIEAIETDDYENLPAAVFTRGYLRSYARLLDLDEEAVIAHYPHGTDESITTEAVVVNPAEEWIRQHPLWVLGSGGVIVLIVIVVMTIWLWANDDAASSAGVANQSVAELAGAGVVAAADALETDALEADAALERSPASVRAQGTSQQDAGEIVDIRARDDSPTAATLDRPGQLPVTPRAASPPASGAATTTGLAGQRDRRITAFGDDVLEFRFTEECWVEIKSNTGRNLYSDLSRAGQTLRLTGEGPFRILLGYAPGVRLAYNDESVALGPHTRNNVATLVLGQ